MSGELINSLKTAVEQLKHDKRLLKEQCSNSDAEIQRQSSQIAELERQVKELFNSLREEQNSNAKLRDDLAAEQESHRGDAERLNKSMQDQLAQLVEQHRRELDAEQLSNQSRLEAMYTLHRKTEEDSKAKHQVELADSNRRLEESEQELSRLRKSCASQESDLQDLLSKFKEPDSLCTPEQNDPLTGNAENQKPARQLVAASDEIGQLRERQKQLEEQLSAERRSRERASFESEQLRQQVTTLERELRTEQELLRKAKQNNETELGLARRDVDSKTAKLVAIQDQLRQATDAAATANQEVAKLQKQLETLRNASASSMADLQLRLVKAEDNVADGERKLAEAEALLANNRRKLAEAEALLADNRRKLADAEFSLADNRRKLAEAEASLADNRRKLAEAEEKCRLTTNELSSLRSRVNQHERREEQLNARIIEETHKRMEAEKNVRDLEQQCAQQRDLLDNTLSEATQKIRAAERLRDEAINTREQLLIQLDQLNQENSILQRERRGVQDRLAQLQAQLDNAQEKLRQSKEKKKLLKTTLRVIEQEFAREREKLNVDCNQLRETLRETLNRRRWPFGK